MTEAPTPGGAAPRRGPLLWPASLVGGSLLLFLLVIYWQSQVFGPLLMAAALAYALEPLVAWLVARSWPRALAVTTVLSVLALLGVLLFVFLAVESAALLKDLGSESGKVRSGLQAAVDWVTQALGQDAGLHPELGDRIRNAVPTLGEHIPAITSFLKTVVEAVINSASSLSLLILLPVYLFYLMLDLPALWSWIRANIPAYDRARSLRVCERLHLGMSAFLRGRLLLALLKGVLTVIGLLFCGTNMAVVVGMGAGFLSIVPVIGPAIGFALALALTLADGVALGPVIGVVAVFVIAEVLENFVLTPLVMSEGADLHALTLIFCVVFWGAVLGAFGALVAIPLTIAVKVVFDEYLQPALRDLAERQDF